MKRALTITVSVLVGLILLIPLVLWAGAFLSLDHDQSHGSATAELPVFRPALSAASAPELALIDSAGMRFRARTAGFGGNRGNVILLHGFPESSAMDLPMIPVLAEAGYQVLAFDQRGYSPGARPEALDAYTTDKLAADVFALADAVGFERFHLVGHDWGAAVGWLAVFGGSERILSWTALSIPHLGAYADAIGSDPDQQERSAYVGFFQTPWLPEALFSFNGFSMMRDGVYGEHAPVLVDEYLAIFSEPGALTAALNWYRASGLQAPAEGAALDVRVPTLFVWGNADPVVGQAALEAQRRHFDGNLREIELDAGHWLMEEAAQAVTEAVLSHLDAHGEADADGAEAPELSEQPITAP
ncbi:MAG: alpha/beta fold hydrolase [Pseudomonadota bacterium]